jgi:Flp pilus assembly pilin Flp
VGSEVLEPLSLDAAVATSDYQRGQGMVEYAFILVLIALVVITVLITTGGQLRSMYSDITTTLHSAGM